MNEVYLKLFELLPREARREIVRVLVEEAGLAKSEVARLMGVTPSAVTRFLRGEAAPSPENLAALYASLTPDEKLLVLHVAANAARELVRLIDFLVREAGMPSDHLHASLLEASVEEILDTTTHMLEYLTGVQRGSLITRDGHQLGER